VKRSQPKRDWDQAHEKSISKASRCRVCRRSSETSNWPTSRGRTHDGEFPRRAEGDWKPMTVVIPTASSPLPPTTTVSTTTTGSTSSPTCTMWEVLQAVADSASGRSNGFETARIRMIGNTEIARVA
jgi:hypothetical protein